MSTESQHEVKQQAEDQLEQLEDQLKDWSGLDAFIVNAQIAWPSPGQQCDHEQYSELLRCLREELPRVRSLQQTFFQSGWERSMVERVTEDHLHQLAVQVCRGYKPREFVLEQKVRLLTEMQLVQNKLLLLP